MKHFFNFDLWLPKGFYTVRLLAQFSLARPHRGKDYAHRGLTLNIAAKYHFLSYFLQLTTSNILEISTTSTSILNMRLYFLTQSCCLHGKIRHIGLQAGCPGILSAELLILIPS